MEPRGSLDTPVSRNDLVKSADPIAVSAPAVPRHMEALAVLESRPLGAGADRGADQVEAGSGASRVRSALSSARSAGSTGIC